MRGIQRNINAHIVLLRQLSSHHLLGAPQHERAHPAAQARHRIGVLPRLGRACVQVTERPGGREQPVSHNRQDRPELHEVVLHGGAGDRQLKIGWKCPRRLPRAGGCVLHKLRLIQNQRAPPGGRHAGGFFGGSLPAAFLQELPVLGVARLINPKEGVTGDHQVRTSNHFSDAFPAFRGGRAHHCNLRVGNEPCCLIRPVTHHGGGCDHQERCERRLLAILRPACRGLFGVFLHGVG